MLALRLAFLGGGLVFLASVLLWLLTGERGFLRAGWRILLVTVTLAVAYLGVVFGGRLAAGRLGL